MKYAVLGVLGVAAIVALMIGLAWAGLGMRWWFAAPAGKVAAQEQIQSAPSRIGAYNHFFDLCAAVQGKEASLDAMAVELAAATDPDDASRIRTNIAGVTAARSRTILQYNADARKDYTVGQFRDSGLPYQLAEGEHVKGRRTSCGL